MSRLQCDMHDECTETVTHIGEKGWVYCAVHGRDRAQAGVERCRKMRAWERKLAEEGKQIPSYRPIKKPVHKPDWELIAKAQAQALAEAKPWLESALDSEPEDYDNHELRAVVEQVSAALALVQS